MTDVLPGTIIDDPFASEIIAILRALPAWRKLELARDMNRMADHLALAGLTRRLPRATEHELAYELAIQRLPPEQKPHGRVLLKGWTLLSSPVDPLTLALRVGATLDRLSIPYAVAGAVAAPWCMVNIVSRVILISS
ncbi:MAG: hypothetical protein HC837_04705 [Chloroflexaceae bacterium]|nr:hypothetical protein [Chloroflexaceae bacterium]